MRFTDTQKYELIKSAKAQNATFDGKPAVFQLSGTDGEWIGVSAQYGPRETYTWEQFAFVLATGGQFYWGQHSILE